MRHSEGNPSDEAGTHFIQIWAKSREPRLAPKYFTRRFDDAEKADRLVTVTDDVDRVQDLESGPVPLEADLVFDVRFLPNPHFVPEFRHLTGRHPKVAKYIREFPQTAEFLDRITQLLLFLLPYYIEEGKSYLTVAFGCTGGQHRSVMIAEEVRKRLAKEGYRVKAVHRDMPH